MPSILSTLESTAKRDGVTMTTLNSGGSSSGAAPTQPATTSTTTSAAATPSGVSSVSLSLSFNGRFLQLQRFFADLQSFVKVSHNQLKATGRLVSVNSISLGAGDRGLPKLTAHVDATVYTLDPIDTSAAATTAPTTPTTTTPSATTTTPSATSTTPASPTPTATAE